MGNVFKVENFDLKDCRTWRTYKISAQIRELSRTVSRISESDDEQEQKGLIRHGGDILSDLLYQ